MFVRKRRRRDSIRKPDTIDRILSSHSSLNPNEGSHEVGNFKGLYWDGRGL
jgi:hypothetical protein